LGKVAGNLLRFARRLSLFVVGNARKTTDRIFMKMLLYIMPWLKKDNINFWKSSAFGFKSVTFLMDYAALQDRDFLTTVLLYVWTK